MDLMMILQGAKVAGDIVGVFGKNKSAKKIAKAQQETVDKYYEFNKEQLDKAYTKAIGNTMTGYVMDRLNMADEYANVKTQLNTLASQSGINLNDSSYNNDAQTQLDLEFETNLQDSYTNLIGRMTDLSMGKTIQGIQLAMNKNDQIKQINNAYDAIKSDNMNKLVKDAMDFGTTAYNNYRADQARQNLGSTNDIGQFGINTNLKLNNFGEQPNYFGSEFSNFAWNK